MSEIDSEPEQAPYERADVEDRVLPRIVDGFVMSVLGIVMLIVVSRTAGALIDRGILVNEQGDFSTLVSLLMLVTAAIPMVLYEVVPVSRRGYTFGKGPRRRVVRWDAYRFSDTENPYPNLLQSFIRSIVPHGGLVFFFVLGIYWPEPASSANLSAHMNAALTPLALLFFGSPIVWVLVYTSAYFADDGRGWHDKAANTVVVAVPNSPKWLESEGTRRDVSDSDANRWDVKIADWVAKGTAKRKRKANTEPSPPDDSADSSHPTSSR